MICPSVPCHKDGNVKLLSPLWDSFEVPCLKKATTNYITTNVCTVLNEFKNSKYK